MNRALRWLALTTAMGMYVVLLQGALVTNTGSANGCGRSWPLCHGRFLPAYALETLIEFSHRAVSGLVGLMVLVVAVWTWRVLRHRPAVRVLAPISVLSLILQSGLGALAVLWPQPKMVLALHFGISLISFTAVLLLAVLVFQADRTDKPGTSAPISTRLRRWIWLVAGYLYIVAYTGAYVRHTGSDLACLDWPLCDNGRFLPPLTGAAGVHVLHRLIAGAAILLVARLLYLAWQERQQRPDLYRGAMGALVLIMAQAAAGATVVLSHLALAARMTHATLVIGLFGVVSYLCLQATAAAAAVPEGRPVFGD